MNDKMIDFAKALEETEDVCSWMRDIDVAWRNWLLKCKNESFDFCKVSTEGRRNIIKPIFEDLNSVLEEYDLGDIRLSAVVTTSMREESLVFRFKSEDGYFANIFFDNGTLLCNDEWLCSFANSGYSGGEMWVYQED